MKTVIFVAGVVLMTACVTVSESEREAREYREVERREQYLSDRRLCRRKGGVLVIHRSSGRFDPYGVPDYRDSYNCRTARSLR